MVSESYDKFEQRKISKLSWENQVLVSVWYVLTGSWLDFFTTLTVVLCHIQALVNDARDGLDLCAKLLLNPFQVEAIIVSD